MQTNKYYLLIGVVSIVFCSFGCGVKGNPQPPDTPPYIGNGLLGSPDSQKLPETSPANEDPNNVPKKKTPGAK